MHIQLSSAIRITISVLSKHSSYQSHLIHAMLLHQSSVLLLLPCGQDLQIGNDSPPPSVVIRPSQASSFPGPRGFPCSFLWRVDPVGDATLWASESAGRDLTRDREGNGGNSGIKRKELEIAGCWGKKMEATHLGYICRQVYLPKSPNKQKTKTNTWGKEGNFYVDGKTCVNTHTHNRHHKNMSNKKNIITTKMKTLSRSTFQLFHHVSFPKNPWS